MTSLFLGLKSLRMEYKAVLAADMAGATPAVPKHFHTMQRDGRAFAFKNTTDVIIKLFVVNPDNPLDEIVGWTEIDPGETFGWDMSSSAQQFNLPPQTKIYISGVTLAGAAATASAGRLRFTSWG